MRTRCPNCATVFRITPEQLRARLGNVRCGQCQAVFNAFDSLIEGGDKSPEKPSPIPSASMPPLSASGPHAAPAEPVLTAHQPVQASESTALPPEGLPTAEVEPLAGIPEPEPFPPADAIPAPRSPDPIDLALAADETPEQSTRAARDAGLVAVRELSESPGYDRWSAGAVDAGAYEDFILSPTKRPVWPFVLVTVGLILTLLVQLGHHFRGELVLRFPGLSGMYQSLNVAIPLPRQVDLVTIEASDLQSDNERGLLILQATLKNRAAYPQAWPTLELTLTDTNDSIIARRVLAAAEYLPPKTDGRAFPGNSETGIKLWLESKQPAAGYRLYVFYP